MFTCYWLLITTFCDYDCTTVTAEENVILHFSPRDWVRLIHQQLLDELLKKTTFVQLALIFFVLSEISVEQIASTV